MIEREGFAIRGSELVAEIEFANGIVRPTIVERTMGKVGKDA